MSRSNIVLLGLIAMLGGVGGTLADIFSVWTGEFEMNTAFGVELASIQHMLIAKSFDELVTGNFLGLYFIPLHMAGFYLTYQVLRSANERAAKLLFSLVLYTLVVGTALHASILYCTAVLKSGNPDLVLAISGFFNFHAYSMVILILIYSLGVAILILSRRSLLPAGMVVVSPLGLMAILTGLFYLLPDSARDAREFITISGFNFPCLIFHLIVTWRLLHPPEIQTV